MNNIKYKCSNFYFASAKSNKKKTAKIFESILAEKIQQNNEG